jgi:hypothetical protein
MNENLYHIVQLAVSGVGYALVGLGGYFIRQLSSRFDVINSRLTHLESSRQQNTTDIAILLERTKNLETYLARTEWEIEQRNRERDNLRRWSLRQKTEQENETKHEHES